MNPIAFPRETLGISSKNRGIPNMNSRVPEIDNSWDGGAYSKPYVNAQPEVAASQSGQAQARNVESAVPQGEADVANKMKLKSVEESGELNKAQSFADDFKRDLLYANQQGNQLMLLNAQLQGPDSAAFRERLSTSQAMAQGLDANAMSLASEASRIAQYG